MGHIITKKDDRVVTRWSSMDLMISSINMIDRFRKTLEFSISI